MQKKAREYWSDQYVLAEATTQIKYTFGLKLSIIEQFEMKQYVAPALDGLDVITKEGASLNSYDPVAEVINQFMHNYYGLPLALAHVHTSRHEGSELYQHNHEEFNHYLQRLQYRKHNPFGFQENR